MTSASGDLGPTADEERVELILYITGATPASARAVSNLVKLCKERLADRYELEIVDLYQRPERAAQDDVVVAPTLIRKSPLPERVVIGDLSDPVKVVKALEVREH